MTSFQMSHALADGTLRVTLSGELKHDQLEKLRRDIGELARAAAVRRLLVDVRALRHTIGPIDTLRLIESYAGEHPVWRTAVIENPTQVVAHHFHETAAINRGYKILHFTDEAKAAAWLESQAP